MKSDDLINVSHKIHDAVMETIIDILGDDPQADDIARKVQLYYESLVEAK